jgi:hypothetical protein
MPGFSPIACRLPPLRSSLRLPFVAAAARPFYRLRLAARRRAMHPLYGYILSEKSKKVANFSLRLL